MTANKAIVQNKQQVTKKSGESIFGSSPVKFPQSDAKIQEKKGVGLKKRATWATKAPSN